MLYISTRNSSNTYTASVATKADRSVDGGRFVPFKLPELDLAEIKKFKDMSFNQGMAEILNIFFASNLSGWDIDFIIGKNTFRKVSMNHKIIVSELWHNTGSEFSCTVEQIQTKLFPESCCKTPSNWMQTAVRVATLFAVYSQLHLEKLLPRDDAFDLVVPAEDMLWPISALIAKQMGLPVKSVVFACCEDNSLWDLVYKGTFSTANLSADLLAGVETVVYYMLGAQESARFREACEAERSYSVEDPEQLPVFLHCTVAGGNRIQGEINSIFRNNGYITDPSGAIGFSGVKDYRAKTGNGRVTILLSESSPLRYKDTVMASLGISEAQFLQFMKH